MRGLSITARLASGYGALERVLRHCERMGFELEHLRVERIDDEDLALSARLGNVPANAIATLAARLEQHFGVTEVAIRERRGRTREEAEHEFA